MEMEQLPPGYGGQRRRLQVRKVRGIPYAGGFHDYAIHTGGVAVYPRLVASAHPGAFRNGVVSSEIEGLDTLLGGGADRGSSLMLLGPAGVGKSTICAQYAAAAARRGERSVVYNFDEATDVWIARADALGMGLSPHVGAGLVSVRQVNPAELTPGEQLWGHEAETAANGPDGVEAARPAGGVRRLSGQAGGPGRARPHPAGARPAVPLQAVPPAQKLKVRQRVRRTRRNGIRFVLIRSLMLAAQS